MVFGGARSGTGTTMRRMLARPEPRERDLAKASLPCGDGAPGGAYPRPPPL
jgi:hypothetical protein